MGAGNQFFEQFIDDYFAECQEHLATIRRVLLATEARGAADATEIQDLARSLHTVKGLSGMVGLVPAEATAHAMEDVTTELRKDASRISRELLELLFEGVTLLERTIEARRTGTSIESADAYVSRVGAAITSDAPGVPSAVAVATPRQQKLLHVTFIPDANLAAAGITVETVRARLQTVGEIVAAVPKVHAKSLYFEFSVQLAAGAVPDESWLDDGMIWIDDIEPGEAIEGLELPPPSAAGVQSAGNLVRVDLAKLDDTMRMIGELVVSRSRLQDAIDRAVSQHGEAALEPISAAAELIERQLRSLREGLMRMRLVPIGEVFERMRFAMREIARESGKSIRIELEGGDTEIDKLVVDRIVEPLMHLVRNAASHGIESPDVRRNAGKPAEGCLRLRARAAGDRIIVEVEDDGAGIDVARVERRAREEGLIAPTASVDPSSVLDIIAAPGFSTRDQADMGSGRGVGMAVVLSTVRGLGGDLTLDNSPGSGTRFIIELPLTLMITDALLVTIGGQSMAVPQILLREIVPLADHTVTRLENNTVISHRDGVLPLVDLCDFFATPSTTTRGRYALVVGNEMQATGLVVDGLLGLREIVVHPLADPYVTVPGVSGATERPDGGVTLILDVAGILRHHRERTSSSMRITRTATAALAGYQR